MERLEILSEPIREVPRRRVWIEACVARDFARSERVGNALLGVTPDDEAVRFYLARLLSELDRDSDAAVHWRYLRDRNPRDLEATFHIARAFMGNGEEIDAAIVKAAPQGSPRLRQNLRALLEQQSTMPERPLRHVAICGLLWCGSTLVDRVLGSLPGVRSVGESHYLPLARDKSQAAPADFSSDAPPRFVPCSVCGENCAVFTAEFRRELAADRTRWFARIAHRLNTDILVSADKVPARLIECDPLLRFDAVVLFKTPAQAWQSKLRKLPPDREAEFYSSECEQHLNAWARTYATFLDHFRPQGKVAFVCFDEFARRPQAVLERLCTFLSLPFSRGALVAQHEGHAIAGNHGTIKKLRRTNYRVGILPLAEPPLSGVQGQQIAAHGEAQSVAVRLLTASGALMSG